VPIIGVPMSATEVAMFWHYSRPEICTSKREYAARTLYFCAPPCPLAFKTGGARALRGGFNGRPLVQWPTGPQAIDVMGPLE